MANPSPSIFIDQSDTRTELSSLTHQLQSTTPKRQIWADVTLQSRESFKKSHKDEVTEVLMQSHKKVASTHFDEGKETIRFEAAAEFKALKSQQKSQVIVWIEKEIRD